MKRDDHPLIREYHDEFEDIYVWKGLPGGFGRKDLYFVAGLVFSVLVIMAIQGETRFSSYVIATGVLLLLSALYKGIKVGIDSVKYSPYEVPLVTRMSDDFLIWARDPPLEVKPTMRVVIRPPTAAQNGVVYLYDNSTRHIVFLAEERHYLDQFARIVSEKYQLDSGEPVHS